MSRPTPPHALAGPVRLPQAAEFAIPLFEVVKRHIVAAIESGAWPAGTVLPSETALARDFGVAVGTVRRATSDLAQQGLLSRQRRIGTVVTGRSRQHSLGSFFRSFRLHGEDGSLQNAVAGGARIVRGPACAAESATLGLAPEAEVIRFTRIRSVDGAAVMHDLFVLPAARLPGFPTDPADAPPLLYVFLLERYAIRISAVREQLRSALADDVIAAALGLETPAAVLVIDEVAYDQANRPTVLATHHATTARHRYINEIR